MQTETNKVICRRFIQSILNEGQLAKIRDFVAADALHHELDGVSASVGQTPENYALLVSLYRLAFPDLRVEIQSQTAESDRVVSSLRIRGTQKGALLGIRASGRPMDVSGIRIDRLSDGKIAESWFHWDAMDMLRQIGALPELARAPQAAPPVPVEVTAPMPSMPALMAFPVTPEATARFAATRLQSAA